MQSACSARAKLSSSIRRSAAPAISSGCLRSSSCFCFSSELRRFFDLQRSCFFFFAIFEPLFVQLQAVGVGLDANLIEPPGLLASMSCSAEYGVALMITESIRP